MHSYEHVTEPAGAPPPPVPRAVLDTLRAARRRPARVAASVAGVQLLAVGLAAEAPGVMGVTIVGPLNLGLTLVLVQLGLTAWAMVWYGRYGRNEIDRLAARYDAGAGGRSSRAGRREHRR
ncbi:DUF485 domain-containing protein [Streptomyces flaveus]|uniref:DUF485 domain-containing protein n=1 Tax=Streptomyces flaveus TaxID=66370 RepID=UPI0033290C9A